MQKSNAVNNPGQAPAPVEDEEDTSSEVMTHQLAGAVDIVLPGAGLAMELLGKLFEMQDGAGQLQLGGNVRRTAKLKTQASLRL
jgi:hypothetical protein